MLNVPSKQSRIKLLFYSVEKAMIKIFYLPADDNNRRYLMIMKVKQTEMPLCLNLTVGQRDLDTFNILFHKFRSLYLICSVALNLFKSQPQ